MLERLKIIFFLINTRIWTIYAKHKVKSFGPGLRVNFRCIFTHNTTIGSDCHFNGLEVVGSGSLAIGNHFHSGSNILIITQNHNYFSPDLLPYDNKDLIKDVIIGNSCWLGSRVIILPGTIIEDGVVVQAGAVLFGKIPKCAVVGGNPWRIIKYRDRIKFDYLVEQNKYV
jgi:acetyltransferase-like isoleucine patch superfamily enzyme